MKTKWNQMIESELKEKINFQNILKKYRCK
jgi:hypothetical protein